jgi:flagellar basal body L-ring protein FlgH
MILSHECGRGQSLHNKARYHGVFWRDWKKPHNTSDTITVFLGFDHKAATQTHSDLKRSYKQWQKTHNHMSYASSFNIIRVGISKNNTS